MEIWDLWSPDGGATGLPFARCRIEATSAVLVHAVPATIRVEVRDREGDRVAFGDRLKRVGSYFPMTRLVRAGATIRRQDGWPEEEDIGRVVLLPGGEAGVLKAWWNAPDGSEWRWQVEFYNRR
jgi:hypothetical protein